MFFIAIFRSGDSFDISHVYAKEESVMRHNEWRRDRLVAIVSAEEKSALDAKVKEAIKAANE